MGYAKQKEAAIVGDSVIHYVLHLDDDLVRIVARELEEFREAFSDICGEGHFSQATVKPVSLDALPATGEVAICVARHTTDEAIHELSVMASRGYALRNNPFRKVDGLKLRFIVKAIG